MRRLVTVWEGFHAHQVYRADALGVVHSGARWLGLMSLGWAVARWRKLRPRSLLDNSPLADLLQQMVPLERLPGLVEGGHLRGLAVSASSYSSGQHVTFFQGAPELQPWMRSQRHGLAATITHQHLLASSAIPFVFPAMELSTPHGPQYFGDGSMRQSAPLAPAIHLGAQRLLVVGAGRMHEPRDSQGQFTSSGYPSLAQIAGHALSNIFLDALSVDVERVQRINHTLSMIPPQARGDCPLKPIELLVIAPSSRLDEIAARHLRALPAPVLAMLGALGFHRPAARCRTRRSPATCCLRPATPRNSWAWVMKTPGSVATRSPASLGGPRPMPRPARPARWRRRRASPRKNRGLPPESAHATPTVRYHRTALC